MSNLSTSLSEGLKTFYVRLHDLAGRIEDSSVFERLMIKYDNLDRNLQARLLQGLTILGLLIALSLVAFPIYRIIEIKNERNQSMKLLDEMKAFATKMANRTQRTYRTPPDWQNLPATSANDLKSSLETFSATISIPEQLVKINANGSNVDMNVKELSIRQALALLFQIDGWYPAVDVATLKVEVNSETKTLLTLSTSLRTTGQAAPLPSNSGAAGSFQGDFNGANNFTSPDTSRPVRNGGDNFDVDSGDGGFSTPPPPPPPPPVFDDDGLGGELPMPVPEEDL